MSRKQQGKKTALPRLRFPGEARLPWLPTLLEMHAVTDAGVAAALRETEARLRARLACREGCSVCCRTQSDIAVFPLELAGISWYCTEQLEGPTRAAVRARLTAHVRGGPCPFLVAGSCAIYVVRPMACRHFTVIGQRCAEGEDPWHTRREDVITPRRETLEKAYRIMLPFHGVALREEQEQWLARGLFKALVRNLPELAWPGLVRMMDGYDSRRAPPAAGYAG